MSETYALLYFNEEGDIEVTHFNEGGITETKVGDIESGFDDVGVYSVILMKHNSDNSYHYAAEIDDGTKDDLGYHIADDLLENHIAGLIDFFEYWEDGDTRKSNKSFDKLLKEMNRQRK